MCHLISRIGCFVTNSGETKNSCYKTELQYKRTQLKFSGKHQSGASMVEEKSHMVLSIRQSVLGIFK